MQEFSKPASNMIVYVAESRTEGGLAELVYQNDVLISPTLSELSVNRTPSETNAVPICTVVRPRTVSRCKTRRRRPQPACQNRAILLTTSELSVNQTPSENNQMEALRIGLMNIRLLSSKALLVQDLIVDNKIDILGLCETWLKPDEFLALNKATPPNYVNAQVSREVKKGAGVVLISNAKLDLKPKNRYIFRSFEVLAFCSSVPRQAKRVPDSFVLAVVYRPPGPYSLFVDEFSDFAADLATYSDNILIIGDLNIHVNNPSDSLARAFLSITCLDPRSRHFTASGFSLHLSFIRSFSAHFPGSSILPLRGSPGYLYLSPHHPCNHHSYGR